jgi:hypothetical protein
MSWLAKESPANALCFTYSLPFLDGTFFATGVSASSTTGATFFGTVFLTLFLTIGVGVVVAGSTSKTESESSGATISELKESSALQ